jgi:2-polyprenyl-6-methoxyphenol hydroxylase-like FAD-dependent oxidoreductase
VGVEVTGLLREHGEVVGVRYRDADGGGELRALVTVACDGRTSTVRAASGLRVREFGVPMDVWWFRLPGGDAGVRSVDVRVGKDTLLVIINRGDYFQMGYQIRKGSDARLRAEGIEAFRGRIAALAPEFADRVAAVQSWDEVKLLAVRLDRLPRWFEPGLLCIGDAAHAMSPVGGVGINLAVQDAVAAARYLAAPLLRGEVRLRDLARVQVRRWAPTLVTQSLQQLVHRLVLQPILAGKHARGGPCKPSRLGRTLLRFPRLQAIPAYIMAIGVLPEHAPPFARPRPLSGASPRRRRATTARRPPSPRGPEADSRTAERPPPGRWRRSRR